MRSSKMIWSALAILLLGVETRAAAGRPVHYRLTANSGYQWGCVAGPCDCATRGPVPVIGTFDLELQQSGPLYTDYRLTNIVWYIDLPEGRTRLAGDGMYRVGGEVAVVEQLELTLTSPDGTVRHFDSGLVSGGWQFPRIDVQTFVTGSECVEAAIHVVAEPAPYTVYRLGQKATFTQGCFGGVCLCAVEGPWPLSGTFFLTLIDANPLYATYALTDVRWATAADNPLKIRGDGLYRIGGEVGVTQELSLDLVVDDAATSDHLRSKVALVSGGFPAIDAVASTDTMCFNRRVDLQARPAGDFDLNGSVDWVDLDIFIRCLTGPTVEQPDLNCAAADVDGDGDVDQSDFGIIQPCFSGPFLTPGMPR